MPMTDGGRERARANTKRLMRLVEPPLTPAALARRSDIDVKTVRAFLEGDRWPHIDTLAKLDRGLGQAEGTIEAWAAGEEFVAPPPRVDSRSDAQPAPGRLLEEATLLELARTLVARLEGISPAGDPGFDL